MNYYTSANIEQLMQTINAFDENVSIRYSRATGKFYISTSINIKGIHGGYSYGNVVAQEYTVKECILSAYYKMQENIAKIEDKNGIRSCKFPKLVELR